MSRNAATAEKENMNKELDLIIARQAKLEDSFVSDDLKGGVSYQIDQWKAKKHAEIDDTAATLEKQLHDLVKQCGHDFKTSMDTLNVGIGELQDKKVSPTKTKLQELQTLIQTCEIQSKVTLLLQAPPSSKSDVPKVIISKPKAKDSSSPINARTDSGATKKGTTDTDDGRFRTPDNRREVEKEKTTTVAKPTQRRTSGTPIFSQMAGIRRGTHGEIDELFRKLQQLPPMNKTAMRGKCDRETTQMEEFLRREFGFENVPGESIVDGVKSFRISRPPEKQKQSKMIYFPDEKSLSFAMSIEEILKWQETFTVYTPEENPDISSSFLKRALAGKSKDGDEAFLMKFVIRISQCPVLMEFDAQVIPREIGEVWPDRIKLVSVTGVDFACRKHDVGDITKYVTNWKDIFQLDPVTKLPQAPKGRDFVVRDGAPATKLNKNALFSDLVTMARTRLKACDEEKVQFVVETGIGLGMFDGRYLGIDDMVRKYSAAAVHQALKEDGPKYRYITALIFALPLFGSTSDSAALEKSTYQAFVQEFSEENYNGPIPVLVIDQDMHRLAVNIAKEGYRVSELNPADSHGVFGEYWQNRGPAVEEKLALTTLGLLVQHHLINPCVLDETRYHRI